MLRLRTTEGMNIREFENRFRRRFDPLGARLEVYADHGLAQRTEQGWRLTPRGFLVSNQIIGELQELLNREKLERLRRAHEGIRECLDKITDRRAPWVRPSSAWRKSLFATLTAFFRTSKSSEKWGSSSCRTPFRVSRTHPSAPLTKGSRSFDRLRRAAPHGCGPPVRISGFISGFLYWLPVRISCRCGCATRPPDPARTSAFCSPPPARHSGGSAHSTSQR